MIDCKEAAYLVDKSQYSKLSLLKKVNLKFHMFMCDVCRKYGKDSRALNKLIKHSHFKISKLTAEEKAKMKEKIGH